MNEVSTGEPLSVLIVEDDDRVREFLRDALEGVARVLEASDGDQALKILEQSAGGAVDLVLVDYLIPKVSGLELLRIASRQWPALPVVMITAFGSEDLAIQALRAGARDYLKKPVGAAELQRVILTHARRGSLLEDRRPTPGQAQLPSDEKTGEATHGGIRRALIFVRAHYTEPITLSRVALEAGLSRFHLCRLFHRQVGLSFREYLHGLRIARAKVLLADPQLTVTEVAYAAGFSDLSHFDKVFRKIVRVSPTQYRRAIQAT